MLKSFLLVSLLILIPCCTSSLGNSFPTYRSCVEQCREAACKDGGDLYRSSVPVSLFIKILWRCNDNCQYICMWTIVDIFQQKGWQPPQFHGKWPFVRFLGIQEPASVTFSLVNLAIHIRMFNRFLKEIRSSTPLYFTWIIYALVSMNGWLWSAVFHTRDLPFTELMDYLSAFCMVLCSAYSIGMRLLMGRRAVFSLIYTTLVLAYWANHAVYLSWGVFDYTYNMAANLAAGAMLAINCLVYCYFNWDLPQSRSLLLAITALSASVYLELADFPPLLWTLDAHSLWHLSTAPVTFFYWRYILEDSRYLQKEYFKW